MFAIAGIALATAIPGFLAGVWLHEESTIEYKRGSPTEEFVTTQKAKAPEAPRPRRCASGGASCWRRRALLAGRDRLLGLVEIARHQARRLLK